MKWALIHQTCKMHYSLPAFVLLLLLLMIIILLLIIIIWLKSLHLPRLVPQSHSPRDSQFLSVSLSPSPSISSSLFPLPSPLPSSLYSFSLPALGSKAHVKGTADNRSLPWRRDSHRLSTLKCLCRIRKRCKHTVM